jgi:hypothetical protein
MIHVSISYFHELCWEKKVGNYKLRACLLYTLFVVRACLEHFPIVLGHAPRFSNGTYSIVASLGALT